MDRAQSHSQGGHSIEMYKGILIQPRMIGDHLHFEVEGTLYPSSQAARDAIDRWPNDGTR